MKTAISKISFCVLLFAFSFSTQGTAQAYDSSVGLRIGTYFAGSYKMFFNETNAVEGIAGFTRSGGQSLITLGALYQIHTPFSSDVPRLYYYYGAGGFLTLGNDDINTNIAFAGNIGLEYTLEDSPLNFFMDVLPIINFANGIDLEAEASVGVRYTFEN